MSFTFGTLFFYQLFSLESLHPNNLRPLLGKTKGHGAPFMENLFIVIKFQNQYFPVFMGLTCPETAILIFLLPAYLSHYIC